MNPQLIGRHPNDSYLDERSTTQNGTSLSIPFQSMVCGILTIEIFPSDQKEDRGGIVLRITNNDQGGSFLPHAKDIESGVEIHIAGDAESEVALLALRKIIDLHLSARNICHPAI
jgi:hypothetical protein